MKSRIKIDSVILVTAIIATIFLWMFEDWYVERAGVDILLDVFGLILILKGSVLRMSARGHKRAHSQNSRSLVTTGAYQLVRNPMYLGSFLIGAGFTILLWPWWLLPVFAVLFYVRFRRQIGHEEKYLSQHFPNEYKKYCQNVGRLFPLYETLRRIKPRDVINIQEALSTHEARGFFIWPMVAFLLETIQELIVFGSTNPLRNLIVFVVTAFVFVVGLLVSVTKE